MSSEGSADFPPVGRFNLGALYRLPVIGDHVKRYDTQRKLRAYDLSSPEGRDHEYDLIEFATQRRFAARPSLEWTNLPFAYYRPTTNTIGLPFGRLATNRGLFWHEAGHALLLKIPQFIELTKNVQDSLWSEQIPDVYPDAFTILRGVVFNEGLVRFFIDPAIQKIVPYLTWEDQINLKGDIARNQWSIDQRSFTLWLRRCQEELQEQIDSVPKFQPSSASISSTSVEITSTLVHLNRRLTRDSIRLACQKFNLADGWRIGFHYINKVAEKIGSKKIEDIIDFISQNPPEKWEDMFL